MLTIGYIANGKSTNRYHLPFVRLRKNIRVKTIYSRSLDGPWPTIEGIYYTTDICELLQDPEINMIVVCTHQDSHYEYAKMILESGKHALIEKPFMMTFEEAEEIFTLAESKGLMVQCYQNRRYDSDFLTVQKVIESGKLGKIQELEMHFDYYRPEIPENSHKLSVSESFLYGHGCHTLDQVISFFGLPDKVTYDVRALLGKNHMNDYFDLDLFFGDIKASVKSSYFRVKPRPSFIVYGSQGMFVKETKDRQEEHLKLFYLPGSIGFGLDEPQHFGTLTYYENGHYHEEKVISEPGDYGRVYDHIYNTLINGIPSPVKNEETLKVMEILETGMNLLQQEMESQ